ncbi:MAG TPA: ABC transporter ATP-binding protein [Solirubrobacteraceae bacterium]|nr:ABC transporter ATP-binding protein [Solirubrobacteraceae bacterium]
MTEKKPPLDVLVQLARLLRPWRLQVGLTLAAIVVATAAALVPPLVAADAIDDGIVKGDLAAVDEAVLVLGIAVVVYALTSAVQTYATAWISQRALASLRTEVFDHLTVLSPSFYDRASTGALISRLTNDVEQLENLVAVGLSAMSASVLALIGTLVAMFVLDWQLALVSLWIFPVAVGMTAVWNRVARSRFRRTRDTISDVAAYVQETLSAIKLVRSFRQEARHSARFAELNEVDRAAQLRTNAVSFAFTGAMALLPALGVTVVLLVGGVQVSDGTKEIGVLVGFIAYFQRLFAPLNQLTNLASLYTSGGAALDKINTVLDEEPSVRDAPDAQPLASGPGEVRFEHVSFGYDADREVLHDIDLVLPAGRATAIVGHNGAGKSTLVNLLARFYDPDRGRVLVDGQDVRMVTQATLRRAIGYSLQDTNMLTGTVRDNLRLAKADATDAELERTLQELGGLEIVRRLPDGLDTSLGSSGATLSPGQLQVIALARTVLSGASIFILDEFTSGVDVLTEARLLDGLERLLEGRTRIVIAHRLHMVERADHVVVVDDGRVVEQGTHASLLATDGAYASLWGETRRLRPKAA